MTCHHDPVVKQTGAVKRGGVKMKEIIIEGKTTEETVEDKQAKQVEVISKNIASLNSSLASIDKKIKK